jgi:3-phosphoshikimate 1-carboxyvinyltransferase
MLIASLCQIMLNRRRVFSGQSTGNLQGIIMAQSDHDSLRSSKAAALAGNIDVPGDKSISHRALILGSLAIGRTHISGLLEGADVLATKDALVALGVPIVKTDDGDWQVDGVGMHGMVAPKAPLDLGNSGTGVRLLMGVVAGQNITAIFTGDASLSSRPMARITTPLAAMGASVTSREGRLPVTVSGTATPRAQQHISTVASAQIKSAILLAGLNARGTTEIIEPHASRDHSESMLRHFGAIVTQTIDDTGQHLVTLAGEATLYAAPVIVPRDPSSAAFAVVAALITPGSNIVIPGIGMNPLRTGLLDTLVEMGGNITRHNERQEGGEKVADLHVKFSPLHGITVPAARAASMIDEYPILSVAAATASGTTTMLGVAELRVKETDRIKVMAEGLEKCGVSVTYDDDSMQVTGGSIAGGVTIAAQHDHRIGMSFLTLGLVADQPITVTGCATIETSFPGFASGMSQLGANISGVSA